MFPGLLCVGFCVFFHCLHCNDTIMVPNLHKPQGMSVSFICNISDNLTLIRWKNAEILLFAYSPLMNKLVRNFTSDRMSVDPATPTELLISHVQESDEGIYSCEAISLQQRITQTWNLTTYSEDSFSSCQHICIVYAVASGITAIIACGLLWFCCSKKRKHGKGT